MFDLRESFKLQPILFTRPEGESVGNTSNNDLGEFRKIIPWKYITLTFMVRGKIGMGKVFFFFLPSGVFHIFHLTLMLHINTKLLHSTILHGTLW